MPVSSFSKALPQKGHFLTQPPQLPIFQRVIVQLGLVISFEKAL